MSIYKSKNVIETTVVATIIVPKMYRIPIHFSINLFLEFIIYFSIKA